MFNEGIRSHKIEKIPTKEAAIGSSGNVIGLSRRLQGTPAPLLLCEPKKSISILHKTTTLTSAFIRLRVSRAFLENFGALSYTSSSAGLESYKA